MKAIQEYIDKASKQLQLEFNITDTRAVDIIERYIRITNTEIERNSTYSHINHISGTVRASVTVIARKYVPMINSNRVLIHYWLYNHKKKLRLFSIIEDGIKGQYNSAIKLHYELTDFIDNAYSDIVNQNHAKNMDMLNDIFYGDNISALSDASLVDTSPINMLSLKSYIDTNPTEYNKHYAKRIYVLSHLYNGKILQVKKVSEYGRTYYKGVNLQSAPTEVRYAALGSFVEYDLNNAAIIHRLKESELINDTPYPYTKHYINNKEMIRRLLADEIEVPVEVIKEVLTVIGFGGRGSVNKVAFNGKTLAVNTILTDDNERKAFYNNTFIKNFLLEQKYQAKIIYQKYKEQFKGMGMNKSQVLASLYQHEETTIMEYTFSHIPESTILLRCHDAYYLTTITPDDLVKAREKLNTYHPLLSLSETIK